MVRKLIWDYLGDFAGYEGRKKPSNPREAEGRSCPIRILTDSESAQQLLGGLDVPRRSRHTEVRIFWLREQMEMWISIGWVEGLKNFSDMFTKVYFNYRTSIGFVPVSPGSVAEVKAVVHAVSKPKEKVIVLVELCCSKESQLSQVNSAFAYIAVTEFAEDTHTVRSVRAQIEEACAAAEALGLSVHVHMHISSPCTSGSPLRGLSSGSDGKEKADERFAELEPILRKLPDYRSLSQSMSLEWPLNNCLWSYPGVKVLLGKLGLQYEAVVRLCRMGLISNVHKLPVGKRLRFVSDCERFCKPLRRYQDCTCKVHAPFSDVNWTETAFYNRTTALVVNSAVRACVD
eukprot:Skav229768  [mRNA]  locus=scaffold3154:115108:116142:+ [translate_table: standard]